MNGPASVPSAGLPLPRSRAGPPSSASVVPPGTGLASPGAANTALTLEAWLQSRLKVAV